MRCSVFDVVIVFCGIQIESVRYISFITIRVLWEIIAVRGGLLGDMGSFTAVRWCGK